MKYVSVTDPADQERSRTFKTYPVLACRHNFSVHKSLGLCLQVT